MAASPPADEGKPLTGLVHIAPAYDPRAREGDPPRYTGHWEDGNLPVRILERGPGWDDPDEAVEWGRARAPIVLIRTGPGEDSIFSAGSTRATRRADGTGEPYPEWPGRAPADRDP